MTSESLQTTAPYLLISRAFTLVDSGIAQVPTRAKSKSQVRGSKRPLGIVLRFSAASPGNWAGRGGGILGREKDQSPLRETQVDTFVLDTRKFNPSLVKILNVP